MDYPIITDCDNTWKALPGATEPYDLQAQGGPVLITDHSAPTGTNGILLHPGGTPYLVKTGRTMKYRLAGSTPATLVRVAFP